MTYQGSWGALGGPESAIGHKRVLGEPRLLLKKPQKTINQRLNGFHLCHHILAVVILWGVN